MSGDGLIGQIGGALAGGEVPMGVIPGGRGNDLARVLGIPTEIPGAVELLAAGSTRAIDVGEVNGRRFLGIASCGFDSDANRIANQARLVKGNLVYLYAALRALAAWKPARFEVVLDGDPREFTGYSVAAANNKAFGGGMFIAPDAELDDGKLDVVWVGQVAKLRFLANLPKVFKGRHVDNDEVTVLRAAEVKISADRPFAVYADGDHLADLPATIRRPSAGADGDRAAPMSGMFGPKLALARAAGALSRRSGRGGGTTLPGRLLLRMAPDAISRLGARLAGGSVIVSATNGKTTTAGMLAAALRAAGRVPVHNRAGSNMTWGVATALLEQRGEEGLFEVDEAWLPRIAAELEAAPDRARQPVPRPARPLRGAGAPRRRVGGAGGGPAPARPGSRSTPTTR